MKKLIVFNWKMYPQKLKDVDGILMAFDGADVNLKKFEIVIAPPVIYLPLISRFFYETKAKIKLALQNVCWEPDGPFTGEISPEMGINFGTDYVVLGHSERRFYFHEDDEMINYKARAVLNAGMEAPIFCVGEHAETRKKGKAAVKQFIKKQITGVMKDLTTDKAVTSERIIFAYEPLWAIGTGNAATIEDAIEMIIYIKDFIATTYQLPLVKVLYGGSVNSSNINDFIKEDEIDGVLIGGASVDKKELRKIILNL